MKQVAGLISTYSSDEFGICSALFELGGMVVMHDASGCNSTYTTHDEPRWYDTDSLVFISAISEMEAIMGDDEKLIRDLVETASELSPAFIAVVGAPIPYMIGTDLPAIASVVEQETGIPCFGFNTNGMQDYVTGISMALKAVTERFCPEEIEKQEQEVKKVNIIGATPLDFSVNGSVTSIKEWIREIGMEPNVCLAMGSSLEEIKRAGEADVNLVISYGGVQAAELLKRRYGMPNVCGVPFGKEFSTVLAGELQEAITSGESRISYKNVKRAEGFDEKKAVGIVGESIVSASLAAAIELETGNPVRVLTPLTTEDTYLRDGDKRTPEEDDLLMELPKISGIIADPLYEMLIRKRVPFYPLPHEAFSGRIYDGVNPNLIQKELPF